MKPMSVKVADRYEKKEAWKAGTLGLYTVA